MYRFSLILLLFLQSTGLTTNDLLNFIHEEEVATIVIYYKRGFNMTSFGLFVEDEEVISSFRNKTYYVIEHPPGKISLETKGYLWRNLTEDKEYSLTLEAGQTYYLEALVEYQVLMTSLHLVKRSSEVGKKEIQTMKGEFITISKR